MIRLLLLVMILLISCTPKEAVAKEIIIQNTSTPTPIEEIASTRRPFPSATIILSPTTTHTKIPSQTPTYTVTPKPISTAYSDGRLNCPGSIALIYHHIFDEQQKFKDVIKLNTNIVSFENVLSFLVENEYYFPTPTEFAADIKSMVCRHKYAIMIIDDSWNDPETMGVVKVLQAHGGGTTPGSPKVWFAVITKMMSPYKGYGEAVDQWVHLKNLRSLNLVYPISHSQTHSAALVDNINYYSSANDAVYDKIADELGPSRKDIIRQMGEDPLFFVYPGGNVNQKISDRLQANGYFGAFTVISGGLHKAYPNYLPRINSATECSNENNNNAKCVIEKIIEYSK